MAVFVIFLSSAIFCLFSSAFYHTFSAHSKPVRAVIARSMRTFTDLLRRWLSVATGWTTRASSVSIHVHCVPPSCDALTDHLPRLVLTVGSFFPTIYYGFFCDPHYQAFYLTCICLAGLGESSCSTRIPHLYFPAASSAVTFAGGPPTQTQDYHCLRMLDRLNAPFTIIAHWCTPHRGIIHRSKPGVPQANTSRCAHEGVHPSRAMWRRPDPAWTRKPWLLYAVLRYGVRVAPALGVVLHHRGAAVVRPPPPL